MAVELKQPGYRKGAPEPRTKRDDDESRLGPAAGQPVKE